MVPNNPPFVEYIATIEKACTLTQPGKVEELRGEVKANIKKMHPQVQSDKRRAQGNGGAQERQDQDDLNS